MIAIIRMADQGRDARVSTGAERHVAIRPGTTERGFMTADDGLGRATPHSRLSGPAYRGEFISRYDHIRPRPPADLFQMLLSLSPTRPPALVVDLGSGTGISTVPWSACARRVIGVELNPEMLRLARHAANTQYRRASAQRTGLPEGCADVVTCAQSFHWMEPDATIAEAARILRPGGIFAAYDYDWPPLIDWEVDGAFLRVIEASGVDPSRPEKAQHLERLVASRRFRTVRGCSCMCAPARTPTISLSCPLRSGRSPAA